MKKNFFKKLSFVMASAMIISAIAPAAGAFAAEEPALNATTKYLHISGVSGSSEFDFNIKNKVKGSTYAWTSSKEAVATVDETGLVTAQGVGSTKISVVMTPKKGEPVTLEATVKVRDNIETVSFANPPAKSLKVNEEYDFNRSYVTESGSSEKTSSIVRWKVDNAAASISDSGMFKATTAGDYKVTAMAFQSLDKYNVWKNDSASNANLLLDSAEITVKVVPTIVSTKQTSTTTFNVTWDSDMSKTDIVKTAVLAKVVNGKNVTTGSEKIKSAVLDTTGKILTVTTYSPFTAGDTYSFAYGDFTSTFTAAKADLSEVTGIIFKDSTVKTDGSAANLDLAVSGVNKDGVVIADGTALSPYLSYTYKGEIGKGFVSGHSGYIYTTGYAADIEVKYSNYVYDATTKAYKNVTDTKTAKLTGVTTAVDSSSMQYAVLTGAYGTTTVWGNTATIAVADQGFKINVRYKNNTDLPTADYHYDTTGSDFTFDTSNSDKLLIYGNTLYPAAAGVVTVIVKTKGAVPQIVGTFDITIQAARTFASASQPNPITVGNTQYYNSVATTSTIMCTDSMNQAAAVTAVATPVIVTGPTFNLANQPVVTASNVGNGIVSVNVLSNTNVTPGAYQYKITITANNGAQKDVVASIIVLDGYTTDVAKAVASWKVELTAPGFGGVMAPVSNVDLKGMANIKNITVSVYGYNAAGVRVDKLSNSEFDAVLRDAAGVPTNIAGATIPVIAASGTGLAAELIPYKVGSYAVTVSVTGTAISASHASLVNYVAGSLLGSAGFSVSDTTTKNVIPVTPIVAYTSGMTVYGAVKAAFDFALNGKTYDLTGESKITKVTYVNMSNGLVTSTDQPISAASTDIRVLSVEITEPNTVTINGSDTDYPNAVYTYTVDTTITVK